MLAEADLSAQKLVWAPCLVGECATLGEMHVQVDQSARCAGDRSGHVAVPDEVTVTVGSICAPRISLVSRIVSESKPPPIGGGAAAEIRIQYRICRRR